MEANAVAGDSKGLPYAFRGMPENDKLLRDDRRSVSNLLFPS